MIKPVMIEMPVVHILKIFLPNISKVRFCYYLSKTQRYEKGDMLWGKREFYKEGWWNNEYRYIMIKKVHRMGPWYYYEIDDFFHNSAYVPDRGFHPKQKHAEPYLLYQDIFGRKSLVREGETTENRHGYQSSYNNIKIKTDNTYTMEPFIPNETWIHLRADDDRGTNIQIMSI